MKLRIGACTPTCIRSTVEEQRLVSYDDADSSIMDAAIDRFASSGFFFAQDHSVGHPPTKKTCRQKFVIIQLLIAH